MKNDDVDRLKFDNWPLPDSYLVELGRVATLWALLEEQMNIYIAKLAGFDEFSNDPRGYLLVTNASFRGKLELFVQFCELQKERHPRLAESKKVAKKLESAAKGRNRLMHNAIGFNLGSREFELSNTRGKNLWKSKKLPLADIRRGAMDVHRASMALHALVTGVSYPLKWEQGET